MVRSPAKSPTIADVARRAGVSLATVSRVMNGNTQVDAAMSERVRAAAAELNYRASPLARSLVLGKTQTVSVIVPDLANPTFQAVLRGLSRAASADGHHILIADTAEQVSEERVLAVETRRRTDGIILVAPRTPAPELAELVAEIGPVVLVNREAYDGVPTIAADYRAALRAILDELYTHGHRRMVFLSGIVVSASNAARLAAIDDFTAVHPDAHIAIRQTGVDFDAGFDAADAVLASGATAAVGFNDLVAMGLLSALSERGVRVPEDLSVTGFDDIPFARFTTPPLTTAAVPAAELGAGAWEAMSALLGGAAAPERRVLQARLVVRGSTGPAPA